MDERCRTCRLTDMQPETTVLFIKEKGPPMKKFGEFVVSTFVAGLLIIVPIYLAVLLLLKAMQSVVALVKPFAMLLPEWIPAEHLLSLVLVLRIRESRHAGRWGDSDQNRIQAPS